MRSYCYISQCLGNGNTVILWCSRTIQGAFAQYHHCNHCVLVIYLENNVKTRTKYFATRFEVTIIMNSNVKHKLSRPTISLKKALLIGCAISALYVHVTQAQSNYQLIEQEIERAEGTLQTTEKFIEQLLWREVPDNQAQTKDSSTKAAAAVAELSALAAKIDETQASLLRARNQLERSNRILAVSQQEMLQAQRGLENLEKQKQVSLNSLAALNNNIQQYEQEILRVSALIEDPRPELERLQGILSTAQQQSAQRDLQAQKLQQTEAQFQQELQAKRDQLNTQNSQVQGLRKQIEVLQNKMASQQGNWAKVGEQLSERDKKRLELDEKIENGKRLIEKVTEEREIVKSEIAKAVAATGERRDELNSAKSTLSSTRKNLKALEQQLRRVQSDLNNDQSAESREIAIQEELIKEIEESNEMTRQLRQNEANLKAEISQLEKRLDSKNQEIAPLKRKTAELRQQKQDSLDQQSAALQQANEVSALLVSTEQRYQAVSRELRELNGN